MTRMTQEIAPVEKQSPEALVAYLRAEIEKWWPIAKAANLRASDAGSKACLKIP
jgi:tripartite-type tricarboxylate transporter receptor subunit TctC